MLPLLLLFAGTAPDTLGYWQQPVAYAITAALDEPSGVLTGRMRIAYVNRSPDTHGGVGFVTRHQVRDLPWTMRVEFPLVVNRWTRAADVPPRAGRLAFRWQVSLSPSY